MPLFVSDDDRVLAPTARAVWDRIIETDGESLAIRPAHLAADQAKEAYDTSREAAEVQGAHLYQEMRKRHDEKILRKRRKMQYAFAARRRSAERVGLEQVRQYRLKQLEQEEREWQARLEIEHEAVPNLNAIVMVRVAAQGELD